MVLNVVKAHQGEEDELTMVTAAFGRRFVLWSKLPRSEENVQRDQRKA
jgi:hypothetical protein